MLGCCGAPAYWAGDDARLQAERGARPRQTWERSGPAHHGLRLRDLREPLRVAPARDPTGIALRAARGMRRICRPRAPSPRRPCSIPARLATTRGMEAGVRAACAGERASSSRSWRSATAAVATAATSAWPIPSLYEEITQQPGRGERQALYRLLRQLQGGVRLARQGVRAHPGRGLRAGCGRAGAHPPAEAGQQPEGEEGADEADPRTPTSSRSRTRGMG